MLILITAIGCALGGVTRHLLSMWVSRLLGERFPWGTLAVNALGSFLLGGSLGMGFGAEGSSSMAGAQAFLVVGFCGGLTTFSALGLQTFSLVSEQAWGRALGNMLGSVLVCVCCVVSGYALGEGWVA